MDQSNKNTRAALDNFPVLKQQTPITCGPASVRMALAYLGHPVDEAQLARRMFVISGVGTLPGLLVRGYRGFLRELGAGLSARVKRGTAVTTGLIFENLEQGLPVIVSFLAENHFAPGTLVGHYSVVIGVDTDKQEITLANAFGYEETIDTERFWRMMEFEANEGEIPFHVKLGLFLRVLVPRTVIVLEREK